MSKKIRIWNSPTEARNSGLKKFPIIISQSIIVKYLSHKQFGNIIALYIFYYLIGRWQKTNQPKAINYYVSKKLGWSSSKVKNIKRILIKDGYIENVCRKRKDGKVQAWYIKIVHIWGQQGYEKLIGDFETELYSFDPVILKSSEVNK